MEKLVKTLVNHGYLKLVSSSIHTGKIFLKQTLKSTLFNLDWPKSRKDTWVRVHNGNSNDLSNNIETGLAGTHPEIMDGNPVVYTRNFYDINFPFWKKKRSFLINKWEINGKTIFNYSF